MSENKSKKNAAAAMTAPEKEEIKTAKFYPDVEFNKKERRKMFLYAVLLVFMLGGMTLVMFLSDQTMSIMSGVIMAFVLIVGVMMIPGGLKQYPVKNDAIIEVGPKEATIAGKTVKISDIYEVRLTITLAPVGTKEENEKFLDEIMKAEPERNMTANLDFTMKTPIDPKGREKEIYTTIANAYEGLLAFYKAGCKHYRIIYSMKKLTRVSTYNLGDTVAENGLKLSQISKKDRAKQLF